MNEKGQNEILVEFPKYINEWQRLMRAYNQIPSWRIFKQLKNIRQREKLTKAYQEKMKLWGI